MVELDLDDAPDLHLELGIRSEHLQDRWQQIAGGALERGVREAVLAAEVVVQQRLIDAGLGGDLLHPRAGGAAADEHRVRRVENPLFGFR